MQAKELRIFCHQIGLREAKFHDLRETYITNLLSNGVGISKVMKQVVKTVLQYVTVDEKRKKTLDNSLQDIEQISENLLIKYREDEKEGFDDSACLISFWESKKN